VATTRDCPFKLDSADAGVTCSKTSCVLWSASEGECAVVLLIKEILVKCSTKPESDFRVTDP